MKGFISNLHSKDFFFKLSYVYITIPFIIFVFGWFKLPLAIISTAVILVALLLAMNNIPSTNKVFTPCKSDIIKIIAFVFIALLWVYLSGIGGFVFQNPDHRWRNEILKLLVEKNWPVIFNDPAPYFDQPVTLVYYFAFWLPAACIGKIFGLTAAHVFLYFWTVIGVLLVFYFISLFNKKLSLWIIIAFIFFSGLDIIGTNIASLVSGNGGGYLGYQLPILSGGLHTSKIPLLQLNFFGYLIKVYPHGLSL